MKKMKNVFALLLAVIMLFGMSTIVFAATVTKTALVTGDNAGTASITVTLPTVGEGATANNTYKIYKVFDATTSTETDAGISYSLVDGKTAAPTGFTVDTAGNVKLVRTTGDLTLLTDAEIAAIKSYVTDDMLAATVTTTASDASFTVDTLPYGYYYITTTTGTAVTVNSTKPNATVADKNEVPPVTKKITGTDKGSYDEDGKKALAEVGSNVTYTATVTKKKGAENYVFHDVMDNTLSYNNDVKVYSDAACTTEVAASNYDKTTASGDTLTVSFNNTYISGLEDETVLYIRYSAKVTSAALQDNPAKNTARLEYGHTPGQNSTPVTGTETYNAQISVLKKDGKNTEGDTDDTPLPNAGFKLYRMNGSTKEYYHLDATVTPNVISWGAITAGDEHVSGSDGKVPAFTGLADGTYYLQETTTPPGFNTADDTTVTIKGHEYTAANLKQEAIVINNKGTALPSTGGIGTTIFYIIGAILVIGAGIVLVTRRRMRSR